MKLRWGIIGAGGIAEKRIIPALQSSGSGTVEAIMRTDAVKLGEMQRKFNIKQGYLSVRELLEQTDIDAVYIASPSNAHAEQAIVCANAGKMVFVEKPVGMNRAEVEDIRDACRSNNVFFSGALMMRYHRLHERMRILIKEGFIGTPVTVRLDFHFNYPDIAGAWRQDKSLGGGGVLMDLGPHCFDTLQVILGCRITKVRAAFLNTQTYSYEVEDSATVVLELEGGIHAVVSVHFNIPEWISPTRIEVFGTEGWLHAEGTLGQLEEGELHYKLSKTEEHGTITMDSIGMAEGQSPDSIQSLRKSQPQWDLYIREFQQFQAYMSIPASWEALMEEQVALQELLDECYRLAKAVG